MQFTIITFGTWGDVCPYLAVGRALRRRGHGVVIATHEEYEPAVRVEGLDFARLHGSHLEVMQSDAGRAWLKSGAKPLQFALAIREIVEPMAHAVMRASLDACRNADALIVSALGLIAGYSVAEKLRIPSVHACLQPISPTEAHPSIVFPDWSWLPGPLRRRYNLVSHHLSQQALWQVLRPAINRARAKEADLPPLPLAGPFGAMRESRSPVIYGYSEHVLPRPADWAPHIQITGFWFLDGVEPWCPPADLLDFLSSGPMPVYVGFGSMDDYDAGHTARRAIDAALHAGYRVVARIGEQYLTGTLPPEAYVVASIPHDWIFPRVAAVVHHGGLGTTGAVLRAGTPSVAVPFFADQPLWGKRVAQLGLGAPPIPRATLAPQALEQALRGITSDPGMRRRAAEFAVTIAAEQGAERAAELAVAHAGRRG
ncbi:MAG: glycosyltransferase [Vicinamibacterales bacterium]